MDNNKLCNIRGSPFRKMSRLRVLSLRNNKMTAMQEMAFKPLRHTMYSLDVEGNPLQCSCGLQWLQEAPYLSAEPRCLDGKSFRNLHMGDVDCSYSRYEETTLPGCDASGDYIEYSSGGIGPTQQLTTYSGSKESTIRPLPEESEYFYEEFVEYEENSSLPFNASQHSTFSTPYSSSTTESSLQTIPPGVLSHFIPGDTPTLYAGTKPQTTTPPSPSTFTRQPSSAFTFFGMPLPSLGSFWGSGRGTDGRGRFTSNKGKGRVQQLPPVMQEGFQPMQPGTSGGFKPIHNPYNGTHSPEDYSSQPYSPENYSTHTHSGWEFSGNSLPHAVISKVISPTSGHSQRPELDVVYSEEESAGVGSSHRPAPDHSWYSTAADSDPLFESGGGGGGELPTSSEEVPTRSPRPIDDMAFAISLPESSRPGLLSNSSTSLFGNVTDAKTNTTEKPTSTSNFLSDLWGSVSFTGRGPTSLSEFLAPGAQLLPTPVPPKPTGRPTITKVTVTPPLGPGPVPMADDLEGPIPRLAKSPPQHYYRDQQQVKNDSMAWYYTNYNKSELEPYVGPGRVAPASPSAATILSLSPLPLALISIIVVMQ